MATAKKTTKKTTKKTVEKRYLTAREYDEFFGYIEKARRMAWRLSEDKELYPEVKRGFKSIEKKLETVHTGYTWWRFTKNERP